ncbi:MAG TPA: YncE family protein [Gemmatimonadales bacterium]|nr:YncE family protein [Gemmatimonadales bacterium]
MKTFLLALFAAGQATAAQSVRLPLDSLPIVARIAVPSRPDWLAMGFGSVWVVDYRPPSVARIDPTTNRVVSSIPLSGDACLGLAITRDAVWVPDCAHHVVVQIDPTTNRVARTIAIDFRVDDEGAFVAADGSLWLFVTDSLAASSTLERVDPASGRIQARIPVGAGSYVVAGDSVTLWVSSTHGAQLERIDPGYNAVTAHVAVAPRPKFVAVGAGGVWVLHQQTGSVSLIDPDRGVVAATVAAGLPTPWGDITIGAGAVWVSVNGTPVTRIDPVTRAVTRQYVGGSGADAIRYGFGSLWVSDHEHGEVWRIDPSRIVAPAAKPQ